MTSQEIFTCTTKKFIPLKKVKSRPSQPWISKHLDQKIPLPDRLYKRSKRDGKLLVEQRYQNLKKEKQPVLRLEHKSHVEDILTEQGAKTTETSKKFWNYVKHRCSDNSGIGTLKVEEKLLTSPTDKEALNSHFRSVYSLTDPRMNE